MTNIPLASITALLYQYNKSRETIARFIFLDMGITFTTNTHLNTHFPIYRRRFPPKLLSLQMPNILIIQCCKYNLPLSVTMFQLQEHHSYMLHWLCPFQKAQIIQSLRPNFHAIAYMFRFNTVIDNSGSRHACLSAWSTLPWRMHSFFHGMDSYLLFKKIPTTAASFKDCFSW